MRLGDEGEICESVIHLAALKRLFGVGDFVA